MNQDPILQKAMDKWEHMSQAASFRKEYEVAGIAHSLNKGREQGLQEGIQKGKEEGIEQGKMQLIRGMHKNGVSIQDIAKMTGLSETVVIVNLIMIMELGLIAVLVPLLHKPQLLLFILYRQKTQIMIWKFM